MRGVEAAPEGRRGVGEGRAQRLVEGAPQGAGVEDRRAGEGHLVDEGLAALVDGDPQHLAAVAVGVHPGAHLRVAKGAALVEIPHPLDHPAEGGVVEIALFFEAQRGGQLGVVERANTLQRNAIARARVHRGDHVHTQVTGAELDGDHPRGEVSLPSQGGADGLAGVAQTSTIGHGAGAQRHGLGDDPRERAVDALDAHLAHALGRTLVDVDHHHALAGPRGVADGALDARLVEARGDVGVAQGAHQRAHLGVGHRRAAAQAELLLHLGVGPRGDPPELVAPEGPPPLAAQHELHAVEGRAHGEGHFEKGPRREGAAEHGLRELGGERGAVLRA